MDKARHVIRERAIALLAAIAAAVALAAEIITPVIDRWEVIVVSAVVVVLGLIDALWGMP